MIEAYLTWCTWAMVALGVAIPAGYVCYKLFGDEKLSLKPSESEKLVLRRIEKSRADLPSMRVDENGTMIVDVKEVMRSKAYREKCKVASRIVNGN